MRISENIGSILIKLMLTRSSRWVDGVEKKKHGIRVSLFDDAAAIDVCHTSTI